jgi:hypothetical protein
LTVNNTTALNGATTQTGDITINSGFGILNKTYAELGAPGVGNDKYIVNKEWVWNLLNNGLANQLTAAQKDSIVQYVLAQSTLVGWVALKDAILSYITVTKPSGLACPAGSYVSDINYASSVISFTCSPMGGCAVRDATSGCAVVWTNSSFCINDATLPGTCQSNVKFDVWSGCAWASSFGIAATTDLTTGLVNWFCPINKFQAGVRLNGYYEPFCCDSANR